LKSAEKKKKILLVHFVWFTLCALGAMADADASTVLSSASAELPPKAVALPKSELVRQQELCAKASGLTWCNLCHGFRTPSECTRRGVRSGVVQVFLTCNRCLIRHGSPNQAAAAAAGAAEAASEAGLAAIAAAVAAAAAGSSARRVTRLLAPHTPLGVYVPRAAALAAAARITGAAAAAQGHKRPRAAHPSAAPVLAQTPPPSGLVVRRGPGRPRRAKLEAAVQEAAAAAAEEELEEEACSEDEDADTEED
jgi:hypothetical protein